MILDKLGYFIRDMDPKDINRVFSDWLRSYRQNSHSFKDMGEELFHEEHRKIISNMIKMSTTKIVSDKKDHFVVIGFINYAPDLLNYIYIKKDFRQFGIGKTLMEYAGFAPERKFFTSHMCYTNATKEFFKKYMKVHNPFLMVKYCDTGIDKQ